MMSLVTSVVGGGPDGTVTLGLVESGPLVGVLGGGPSEPAADWVCVSVVADDSGLEEPLEELDPQPAMSAATPTTAASRSGFRAMDGRARRIAGPAA
jgi:hypothetical protein